MKKIPENLSIHCLYAALATQKSPARAILPMATASAHTEYPLVCFFALLDNMAPTVGGSDGER
jgi:hypothetical protein